MSTAHAALTLDHQLLTVDEAKFFSFRSFFSNPQLNQTLGTKWLDDRSGSKGFIFFPNQTYIEIWISAKVPYFLGYQEGLNVSDLGTLQRISRELRVPITTHVSEKGTVSTVGRLGTGGYPLGGVFYIHTTTTKKKPDQPGITQTFFSVPGGNTDQVNQPLIEDYNSANLELRDFEQGRLLVARDKSGVERNVVVTNPGSRSNLIAVGFTLPQPLGANTILPIHLDMTGAVDAYLWMDSNIGTIVFDTRLFAEYFPILQRNRLTENVGRSCSRLFEKFFVRPTSR